MSFTTTIRCSCSQRQFHVWVLSFCHASVDESVSYLVGQVVFGRYDFGVKRRRRFSILASLSASYLPLEQCDVKPLLVDDYKGLYYLIYCGL